MREEKGWKTITLRTLAWQKCIHPKVWSLGRNRCFFDLLFALCKKAQDDLCLSRELMPFEMGRIRIFMMTKL